MCTGRVRSKMVMGLQMILYSAGVAVLTCFLKLGILNTFISWSLVVIFGFAGFFFGAAIVLNSGKRHKIRPLINEKHVTKRLASQMMEAHASHHPGKRKVVTTHNLDLTIQELLDLIVRDYVFTWYDDLSQDRDQFKATLEIEVWHLLKEFGDRSSRIDLVNFCANRLVNALTCHFKSIRLANPKETPTHSRKKFALHPWLVSPEREEAFLRKVADVFLIYLLPKSYRSCHAARHLLREILACSVFKPAIDLICDPDYINDKWHGWLAFREQLQVEHKQTYHYAASYEDFVEIIRHSHDIEQLKHMRYNILSEIMQATTIQNLKRARGINSEKERSPSGTTKGDLLRARNLNRYNNQLTVAKTCCEKRIHSLGGPDYSSYSDDTRREERLILGKKIYSFDEIMESEAGRACFLKYLQKDDNEALIKFWNAVENMQNSSSQHRHELASQIYQMYLSISGSLVRTYVDRATIKGMASFMMGNTGPESFYEAQRQITKVLEEKYYPSFIVSDVYHRHIIDVDAKPAKDGQHGRERTHSSSFELSERILQHSTYGREKLSQLDEKIRNKSQALSAMKGSHKSDSKLEKIQKTIEGEITQLKSERHQLEFHLDRTNVWIEHVGNWRCEISSAEVCKEEHKPIYLIIIQFRGAAKQPELAAHTYQQGWIVSRKLEDFHALQEQLLPINPDLKIFDLPSVSKLRFKPVDGDFLKRSKEELEKYLNFIMGNENLSLSEAVFAFFSPSPEHLKQAPTTSSRQRKFSLANFFRSISLQSEETEDPDELIFLDDGKEDGGSDFIAKPSYQLLGEIFQLGGVFKWLRQTIMVFVKVTFGRSINRQIRDTMEWIVSEPMMIYYLQQFRDAYWPDGKLAEIPPPRTDEEKLRMRRIAKEKILENLPDALGNLLGEKNARQGAIRLFEGLQDIRLNKHLFYDLLELFLYELFPELNDFGKSRFDIVLEEAVVSPPPMPTSRFYMASF